MTNLTDMLSKFMNSNTASTSGSGTLPSNTITNPKVDLKGITTLSGVSYQGPTIPTTSSSPPKVVERETEVTPGHGASTNTTKASRKILSRSNLDTPQNYDDYDGERIEFIDWPCEEYSQERFLGYLSNSIDPNDQEKTTFTCPYGTFAYRRMHFGLCNAPGTFQRQDASKVRRHQSLSELGKSHFMVKEGIVIGHKISKNRIEVDKAKVDVIAKLPHPTTVKGVRSFLGHVGFYRQFIKDFSKISQPMTHLLEKNTLFIFSNECIQAFEMLKKKLTEAPILIAPDWDLPFELMCDASDFAIGAVLGQRHEKHFRPIPIG
ncbi:reverse transcriptase domain-containing protein [Tanacetum coccineum]|uniref:Reverse transcriptase domain-containing protein n=1 Tax=Tanacetum coccineum TaxID=301880 RepID=A0ABQ4X7T4_9ASTR